MIFVLRATPTITVQVVQTCVDHVTINSDITPVRRPVTLSVWPVGKANTAPKVNYVLFLPCIRFNYSNQSREPAGRHFVLRFSAAAG